MAMINPHINFNGNAEKAMNFYRSVFGGDFTKLVRFKDIANDQFPVDKKEEDKIMHIALAIGKNVLIANDVPESMGPVSENENRSKIAVTAESLSEAKSLFKGLSENGEVEVLSDENEQTFFAMLRDQFGIEWIINFEGPAN